MNGSLSAEGKRCRNYTVIRQDDCRTEGHDTLRAVREISPDGSLSTPFCRAEKFPLASGSEKNDIVAGKSTHR